MTRIAVIEDDLPTSNQLAGWIRSAKSGIVIDQWFTRDEAEAALRLVRTQLSLLWLQLDALREHAQAWLAPEAGVAPAEGSVQAP